MQQEQGSAEEKRLESLLFGYAHHQHHEAQQADLAPAQIQQDLFYIDTAPRRDLTINADSSQHQIEAPAWNDEEETETPNPQSFSTPKWAANPTLTAKDSAPFQIFPSNPTLNPTLAPDTLNIIRLQNANAQRPTPSGIKALQFHQSGSVLLTAGIDKTLNLFRVDGRENAKIQSLFFQAFPIHDAVWSAQGREILCLSQNLPHFYAYNLQGSRVDRIASPKGTGFRKWSKACVSPTGKMIAMLSRSCAEVSILNGQSKQLLVALKANSPISSVQFSPDERFVYACAQDRNIYLWDLHASAKCLAKATDEGGVKCTALALSPDGSMLACGSDSGIVNLYSVAQPGEGSGWLHLVKSMENLTTSISHLSFNAEGTLLGASSAEKADQLRILHVESGRVYSNWPTSGTPLGRVSTFDWSAARGDNLLCIGNHRGVALLYKHLH